MTIVVNCPGCRKRYELDGALAGKKSRCRQCGEVFRIPVPTARMVEPAAPPPTRSAPAPVPAPREPSPIAGLLDGEPAAERSPRPYVPPSRSATREPAASVALPTRARPAAVDDDSDDDIPRPKRTGFGPERRSAGRRDEDTEVGVTAFGWYALLSGLALLLYYAFIGLFEPEVDAAVQVHWWCGIVLLCAGVVLCVWGNLWLMVVAFRVDVVQGLLCMFVPFYPFLFIVNRWHERRGLLALSSAPMVMLFMNIVMMWLVSTTTGGRLSAYPGIFRSGGSPAPRAVLRSRPARPRFRSLVPPGVVVRPDPGPDLTPRQPPATATTRARRHSAPPDPEVPAGADAITRSLIELSSSDQGKRSRALDRLQRSTPDGRVDQVVDLVLPMLEEDDMFRVIEAEKTLAVWRSPGAMQGLIGRLRDNRHFVLSEAIKALGHYRDPHAAEAIVQVVKEDGFAAEDALVSMGEVAEPALIPILQDPDSDRRSRACRILGRVGGQATLAVMRSLRPDSDLGVRMAAQDAWKRIVARVGPPPKPARGDPGKSTSR